MSEPPVLIRRDGGVGEVVLNRPAALNAVTVALTAAFVDAVAALVAGGARAIVVRGAGTSFCAGGDVDELAALRDEGPEGLRRLFGGFRAMCQAVEDALVPVVAAVHGFATAGGFELAQSCDIVLVADDARLADNHTNFAMLPGGGGTQRLPRLVGHQRALAHILTGDRLTGEEAVAWGLAYRAVPAGELQAAADALARRLAAKDPATLAGAKALVREGLALQLAEGLSRETDAVVAHLARPGALDRLTTVTTTTKRSAP
jgi:enoyl-CoA hydratase/carnithine racemase